MRTIRPRTHSDLAAGPDGEEPGVLERHGLVKIIAGSTHEKLNLAVGREILSSPFEATHS
jgi:hypothetical protein